MNGQVVRPIDANKLMRRLSEQQKIQEAKYALSNDGICLMIAKFIYPAVNEEIEAEPTLDYAPVVHAHWESDSEDEHWCSHCNSLIEDSTALEFTEWGSQYICLNEEDVPLDFVQWSGKELPLYCPHCGARMDGDGE